jgi:fermentation-respiration switch protein FrsA (DUF1100 family)
MAVGDDVINRSPLAEVTKLGTRPLEVVHGTADGRIAYLNGQLLEAALQRLNPASQMWTIQGGHHVQGPFLLPDEYQQRVGAFFEAALSH